MPYEGEYAGYNPLRRIVETERVQQLLKLARVLTKDDRGPGLTAKAAPESGPLGVDFIVAIDGSYAEVDVKNGYPGAKVGYCTVASVVLNLKLLDKLDEVRPVNPQEFRKTEQAATIDAALPGSNVVTRTNQAAKHSLREALYEVIHGVVIDEEDRTPLLETYEHLLALKPASKGQACPYQAEGCSESVNVGAGVQTCACPKRLPIYSTDALRIHEGFRDYGTNGELLGEVMQVWERILLVHLLRCFERRGWLDHANRIAFIMDGPLAVFGHPAWLSAAISTELKRINAIARERTGADLLLLGIEKSGAFVTHFEELDQTENAGETRFGPRSFALLTDKYIKERIIYSSSEKRYGLDTYFGRKFFYKTQGGAKIVATIPFLTDAQDTLTTDDISLYPQFPVYCNLLDKLVSARYPNALSPVVSAHSQAAIPLHLGGKVLEQLARALVRRD